MRGLVCAALGALALASAGDASTGVSGTSSLRVTYWEGAAHPTARVVWTLRCDPARGTLPDPARACIRLVAGGAKLFAPVPHGVACTEIYGGPQKARVVGTVRGTHVWATFTRTNGCEIGRWRKLSPWLLPAVR